MHAVMPSSTDEPKSGCVSNMTTSSTTTPAGEHGRQLAATSSLKRLR